MKKFMKNVIKSIGLLISFLIIYILYMTFSDYRPKKSTLLTTENTSFTHEKIINLNTPLSLLSFNIGYCGLDKDNDFFVDGGKNSRSLSVEQTNLNLDAITEFITTNLTSFVFLQEVDIDSTRSYHTNQYERIAKSLPTYHSVFAYNFNVPWIPFPITHPHGKVRSGLATYSTYSSYKTTRYQYPSKYKWPLYLYMLDRCFVESRIKVANGKDLLLINTHLSAFDDSGALRKKELSFLKEYIVEEYKNGNYIIVGGDWNQILEGTTPSTFTSEQDWPNWLMEVPSDFKPEGFEWIVDTKVPTNRTVDTPYRMGSNFLSVIDGFLVSKNVQISSVKGFDLSFEHSDHNPVIMEFWLQ